jgi:GntR family transcriptional regulator / MocR family aminotransferase
VTAGTRSTARSRRQSARRIRLGALPAGIALPPTRALAAELGVTRGVVEAYAQLVAEGYLTSRSGGYTRVAPRPVAAPPAATRRPERPAPPHPPRPVVDFGYGRGNVAAFPRAAWLRSVRRVLTGAADDRLGYLDGRGAVELRSALAAYLNRVRGTNADPEMIVITSGYAQTVSLLMGVLAARGAAPGVARRGPPERGMQQVRTGLAVPRRASICRVCKSVLRAPSTP